MIEWHETFRVKEPEVVGETLDGETIVINLKTGSYFSINPTGSVIWELMRSGFSVRQIIESAAGRYDADRAVIEKAVQDFLTLLKQSTLITMSHATETDMAGWIGLKEPFVFPTIEEYSDMQEMLLADPIHDVTSVGWPNRKVGDRS